MTTYLLESALCLACFYGFYHLALRRETFFQWSRAYLLIAPLLAMVLPALNIRLERDRSAESFSAQLVEAEKLSAIPLVQPTVLPTLVEQAQSTPLALHRYDWSQPVAEGWSVSLAEALWILYGLGAAVLLGVLALRFGRLLWLLRRCRRERQGAVTFATSEAEEVPLASFFGYIFWNKNAQVSESQQFLLEHELVHVRQRHSLDVLLMELMVVLQWFNPLMHAFRHSLCAVHEYIADDYVVRHTRQRRAYATLLVQQATTATRAPSAGAGLVNTFHSLIKQRLIMLAKRPSRPLARAKFALALPLAAGLMLLFSFRLVETLPAAAPLRAALESAANYAATLGEVTVFAEKTAAPVPPAEPEPTPYIFYWGQFQCAIFRDPGTDTYFGNAHLTPAEFRESVLREPRLWDGNAKTLLPAISLKVRCLAIFEGRNEDSSVFTPEKRAEVFDFASISKPGNGIIFSNSVLVQSDYNRSDLYAASAKGIGDLAFEVQPGEFVNLSDLTLPNGKMATIDLVIDANKTGYRPRGIVQIQSSNTFYRMSSNRPEHLAWGAGVWETLQVRESLTADDFWEMLRESPLFALTGDTLPVTERKILLMRVPAEPVAVELNMMYDIRDLKTSTEENWRRLAEYKELIEAGTRIFLEAAPIGSPPEILSEKVTAPAFSEGSKSMLTVASFDILPQDDVRTVPQPNSRHRFTFEWGKFSRTSGMLFGTSVTDRSGKRVSADPPFSHYTFDLSVADVLAMLTQTPHLWKEDKPLANTRFRVRYSDELMADYDPAKGGLPADFVAALKSRLKPHEHIILEGFEADGADLRNLSHFVEPHEGVQKPLLPPAASREEKRKFIAEHFSCSPNPATDQVTFRFTLPEAGAGTLRISNALGQEVYTLTTDFAAGENTYPLLTRDLKGKGQFFASLEMPFGKTTLVFVVQ